MPTGVTLPFYKKPHPVPTVLQGKGVMVVCGKAGPTGVLEHTHPELHIIVLFRSSSFRAKWKTLTGYRERELLAGQVCIIPSNQSHEVRWDRDIDIVVFTIDPIFVLRVGGKNMPREALDRMARYGERDLFIEQLTLALRSEIQHRRIPEPIYLESLATVLSAHLLRRYLLPGLTLDETDGGLPSHKLRSAIDYIHEYLERGLTLTEIAQSVKMSPYHFARLFKKSTGVAPHQYVIQCRVERSKALLGQKNLSLVEIALQAGFRDQSHFTTVFRKWTGMTPKVYRNTS